MTLTAYDLWKTYGDRQVVAGVSFSLNGGEVLGMLGPNGAGKTTTVGMLYGAVVPSRGFVRINDFEVASQGPQARSFMGIVPQDDNLDPDFTVLENLTVFAHYYRITGREARKRAGELLAQVGLESHAKQGIDELSGGMRRRLVLARALINRPQVIFLDEPTTGLDPDARQDFWKLVIQLRQRGCGILLTTHYMDEAQRLCDRLLLLQQGQMMDQGSPLELIDRIVGKAVVELSGVDQVPLMALAAELKGWCRPFGDGHLVTLPPKNYAAGLARLQQLQPRSLIERQANLEDVFLRLTGHSLSEEEG